MNKLKNSLLAKYLGIILIAMTILPVTVFGLSLLLFNIVNTTDSSDRYYNGTDIEKMWHTTAQGLSGASDAQIRDKLIELKNTYSDASVYWVDNTGTTRDRLPESVSVPTKWSASYAIDFMKKHRGGQVDPYTVVAFIGESEQEGFMVLQLPRADMVNPNDALRDKYNYILPFGLLVVFALFILVSTLFFYRIRKRLLRLQKIMAAAPVDGIPSTVEVKREDEIGRLELSFNRMIQQLEKGKAREREEEALRKELIANLSHDLRTPLTTIRGHAYRLKKEPMSANGQESLDFIDDKINYMGDLIENLLSYTLLTTGKYPLHSEKVDVVRLIRTSFAAWYPLFENLEFEIQLDIPEKQILWDIDPQWFRRILDNLFQNIHRHAKSGQFVSVQIEEDTIIIEDHGPGMKAKSSRKGVGIGLSIVSLMLKEMKLNWEIKSGTNGTLMKIKRI